MTPLEWVAIVFLSCIGLNLTWIILRFLFTTFIGSWLGLNVKLDSYGPWAVVTGATDGIGKAYAKQLATAGLNVAIVSRSPCKLQATADEIRALNPFVQVKTIAVDFTEGHSIYKPLANELANLEIGILINNVGMNVGFCQPFVELASDKSVYDIINCNVVSMVRTTQIVLPQMAHRRRGVVINVSSFTGAVPCPLGILYSATKSFVDSFSRGLSAELRSSGVIVQTVLPGFVLTNMASQNSNINETSPMVPNPDDYVKANFRTLGLESRSPCFWFHKFQLWWAELGNFMLPSFTSFIIMKTLSALRRKDEAQSNPVLMK